ncbi:hydrogenase iron-sulfur subunit [candidate division WOR-3 bacterium]|jgi:F420-non-reducing hydrogenase iron-sulfur subunit|nr:hydrogenase iron-sulfur subunit [candidate division WOR-3 bacterium]
MNEPTIVSFLCNWCSYEGADKAGGARMNYPANIRIVRVMCSGRVDPELVIQALKEGASGVLILGCHPGDCHYKKGNYKALRRAYLLKKTLKQLGIEEERVRLDWVAAGEGERFAEIANEMAETMKNLGPLELS